MRSIKLPFADVLRVLFVAAAVLFAITFGAPGQTHAQTTVSLTVESIYMIDDSDDLSDADCRFWLTVEGSRVTDAVWLFEEEEQFSTGKTYGVQKRTLVLKDPGEQLDISISGIDNDSTLGRLVITRTGTDMIAPNKPMPIRPRNGGAWDSNVAQTTLDLATIPGEKASKRLTINSKVGFNFRFRATVIVFVERAQKPPAQTITGKAKNNSANKVFTDLGEMTTIQTIPGRKQKSLRQNKNFYGTFLTTNPYGDFEMVLSWDGNEKVIGTFSGNGSSGTISGTLFDGKVLIFKWSQEGGKYKGSGKFVLSDDGQSFTGTYSNNLKDPNDASAGNWNGTRKKN